MWALARDSRALDLNSPYYYLTLANEFSDSCIVARSDSNSVVGFICGLRLPRAPDTLFVWQIAVSDSYRRRGIAQEMLRALLARLADERVSFLEATVTPSNGASQKMFRSFAEKYDAPVRESAYYSAEVFPGGGHEEERLLRIGPFGADLLKTTERESALRGRQ